MYVLKDFNGIGIDGKAPKNIKETESGNGLTSLAYHLFDGQTRGLQINMDSLVECLMGNNEKVEVISGANESTYYTKPDVLEQKVREVKMAMEKEGLKIFDKSTFQKSILEAIADSDQGGLE